MTKEYTAYEVCNYVFISSAIKEISKYVSCTIECFKIKYPMLI